MPEYTPKYFQTYSPRVRVLVKDLETAQVLYDISDDLTSISTNKAYGRCSGTWQLMLPYRKWQRFGDEYVGYMDVLQPNQMLTVEMDAGNGAGFFPVMCGMIDRVSAVRQGGDVPQRAVKVSGRDMGKLLETHDVAFDIIAYNKGLADADLVAQNGGTIPNTRVSREWDRTHDSGSAGTIIRKVFDITMKNDMRTVKRVRFNDFTNDLWMVWNPNKSNTQGTPFWQYVKQIEHRPFNVLTTDTNHQNVDWFEIVLERYPYDPQNGALTRTNQPITGYTYWHTIGDTEIVSEDLGVSDQERVNLLSYQPAMNIQGQIMSYDVMMAHPDLTRWDKDDILINGLCPQVFVDNFTPPEMEDLYDADPANQRKASETAKGATDTLWNWYRNNHTYESGSVVVHLRPDIRVGNGLLIQQLDGSYKEYLVEQVSHQCVFNPRPQFFTTLQLTRGQKAIPRNAENAGKPQPVTKATP
ncbi:MAG: hypothetical protein AB7I29_07055 [Geobacter sp.]